jgi:hypothetical protein
MAKAIKDAVAEKIEPLGLLDEPTKPRGFIFLWVGSAVLALATTTGGFFLVRRLLKPAGK